MEVALRDTPDLVLGIGAQTPGSYSYYDPFVSGGCRYYAIGRGNASNGLSRVAGRWRGMVRPDHDLDDALKVMSDFRPDLVHVHGTENRFGLIASRVRTPLVISIQGVLSVCALMDSRGMDTSLLLSLSAGRFVRGHGAMLQHFALGTRAAQERVIIKGCRHFVGRTRWDADVLRVLNPAAHYYHCDEPLRAEFRGSVWDGSRCEPQTVYTTMGDYALKGMGTLLRAIALLRDGPAPEVRLRVAGLSPDGSEGGRAATREIRRLGLSGRVTLLGMLGPDGLVRELLRANAFALPSHIDNGSNSLSEAMSVGTPCVASAAGGIPTTARDGIEALLVQDGDPYALAGAIDRVLRDAELAGRLSLAARRVAIARHDPARIRETLLDIYRTVLAGETGDRARRS
jgi:glycosyltransferase involved in cell wall biosynthesis